MLFSVFEQLVGDTVWSSALHGLIVHQQLLSYSLPLVLLFPSNPLFCTTLWAIPFRLLHVWVQFLLRFAHFFSLIFQVPRASAAASGILGFSFPRHALMYLIYWITFFDKSYAHAFFRNLIKLYLLYYIIFNCTGVPKVWKLPENS